MATKPKGVTTLLTEVRNGNQDAASQLVALVYPELRRMAASYMRHERPGHTLQATALVHEAFVRLFGSEKVEWRDRAHFFALAATQMRRILVDHARTIHAAKRGGHRVKLSLTEVNGIGQERDEDLIAVDEALTHLEAVDPRASRIVELRFFSGLPEAEAAEVLGISVATLKRDWRFAKAWLFSQLQSPRAQTRPLPRH